MFNNTHSIQERQNVWRELRHRSDLTPEIIVSTIGATTVQNRYLDFYSPDSWPSVFEIVQHGMFDLTGLTIVITATLADAGFINSHEVTLDVISNHVNGNVGALLHQDDRLYNFLPGKITPSNQVQEQYTRYDRHIIALDNLLR